MCTQSLFFWLPQEREGWEVGMVRASNHVPPRFLLRKHEIRVRLAQHLRGHTSGILVDKGLKVPYNSI